MTLESLTAFTVTADYGRAHTTYNIHVDAERAPVARMHKDAVYSSLSEYRVYTGPALDQLVGYATNFGAKTIDRTALGEVSTHSRTLRDSGWTVVQNDLGELTGESVGASTRLRRDSRLGNLFAVPASEFAFTTRLHFRSSASTGFELTRLRGIRARYAVHIHDVRVNKLLVLACVSHYAERHAQDIRLPLAEMTSNPFKR
ncbi:hypothetical protein ACIRP3_01220 [Streptomyces sp. NPDC101209]|uniref:hypothetical protein n=1 Tax=Streptomyces sp. NPDC101209 TaxID=3366129 RepID=UPI003827C6B1